MPQHDPRYRGRRRNAPPRRKPGHLRTNYAEDDIEAFSNDLAVLRKVWPAGVLEADRKASLRQALKQYALIMGIVMVPLTALTVWAVIDTGAPWWMVPAVQSAILTYILFRLLILRDSLENDTLFLIYREADRRGIKYVKGDTPLHHIMNRLNADYNSHLWSRNFKWK